MKNIPIRCLLLPAMIILLSQCKDKQQVNKEEKLSVSRFQWLHGSWEMKEKEGLVTEEWKPVNDSLMEGRSDFIKGDSLIPFETIRLYRQGNDFYYEAKAAGQNDGQPVAFKLSMVSDTGFVAENPQHDFPKRISYTLVNKDSIHAFVDGGSIAPEKKSDFYYARKKQ